MRKKMKSAAIIILSLALAGAVLTGCGDGRQSGQDTQQSTPADISKESEPDSLADSEKAVEKIQEGDAEKTDGETTEKTEEETVEKAEEDTQSIQTGEVYEDNFAVDSEAAEAFARKVKDAAAQKDLEALAELTAFPVYVGLPDVDVVETKEDFLNLGAETVFTEGLLKSVEAADIENFQPSMAGFSISDGGSSNINFGVVDGELAINGINY